MNENPFSKSQFRPFHTQARQDDSNSLRTLRGNDFSKPLSFVLSVWATNGP